MQVPTWRLPKLTSAVLRALSRPNTGVICPSLEWLQMLPADDAVLSAFVTSCSDPESRIDDVVAHFPALAVESADEAELAQEVKQLLALRGLLAGHGVLWHCLCRRPRIDYGIRSLGAHATMDRYFHMQLAVAIYTVARETYCVRRAWYRCWQR
jgi:hypothetical protein